jgi:lactosylceramide 4-alpha-galactosyltransferase
MKPILRINKYGLILGIIASICFIKLFGKTLHGRRKTTETENNIYFIESNHERDYFDNRQLCSIESAAKHNPDALVIVKSVKATIQNKNIFEQYPNIKYESLNSTEAFMDTPLYDWWYHNKVTKIDHYYRIAHVSDALRLALVYKYGGLYSDLDTIALKSFKPFFNYSGFFFAQDPPKSLINSFFLARKQHPFLYHLMEMFVRDYDPTLWTKTGQDLIQKYLPIYCNASVDDLLFDNSTKKTCDLVMFPYQNAYSFSWSTTYYFFKSTYKLYANKLKNAYSLHFHAKGTDGYRVNWNSSNIYDFFAYFNCPLINDMARKQVEINGTTKTWISN